MTSLVQSQLNDLIDRGWVFPVNESTLKVMDTKGQYMREGRFRQISHCCGSALVGCITYHSMYAEKDYALATHFTPKTIVYGTSKEFPEMPAERKWVALPYAEGEDFFISWEDV